jgi:hypothetical protein
MLGSIVSDSEKPYMFTGTVIAAGSRFNADLGVFGG